MAQQVQLQFARALKVARKFRDIPQEGFSNSISRTYVSALERELKSPTLRKIEAISEVLQLHPMTLVALSYLQDNDREALDSLLALVKSEVTAVNASPSKGRVK